MNNIITASRMNTLIHCARKHFWSYEVGLVKDEPASKALRFGSAWHAGMEARWNGATYDQALVAAIPEGIDLYIYDCSTIAALLAGYYTCYGEIETAGKMHPEIEFGPDEIAGTDFVSRGKIDSLGSRPDNCTRLVESKTTGDSIAQDSEFWMRLRFNLQVYQYVTAARQLGWDVLEVLYDVTRKPGIKPKQVGKGKAKHMESPDEYCERLYQDTITRPGFYFARKEVPILDEDLRQFENQRLALCKSIGHYRGQEQQPLVSEDEMQSAREIPELVRDQEAWPRNVSFDTCKFCPYKSFCLSNITPDLANPPQGYSIKPFNTELNYHDTTETEITDTAA